MANRLTKIIFSFLLLTQIAFWVGLPFAQAAAIAAPLFPLPISSSGDLTSNNIFNAALLTANTVPMPYPIIGVAPYPVCKARELAFEATDNTAQQLASIGQTVLNFLGGTDTSLAIALWNERANYYSYLTCMQAYSVLVDKLPTGTAYLDNEKQQIAGPLHASILSYTTKLATVTARYNNVEQGYWKAFLVSFLLQTSKTVADALVNKLVSNYKITNLKAYTDSVATLMYDNQFLRDNFPNSNQEQMMARQILTNPLLRSQIQPGIYAQANAFVNPTAVNFNSPNYYTQLAAAGATPGNPYFIQAAMVSGVDQSRSSAITTAQAHISQGSGYKAPVNCAGSLAQQQSIDAQTKAASDLLANRQQLLANLLTAQATGQKVNPSDIAKAQADVAAAQKAWDQLPFTVTGANSVSQSAVGGGNNTQGTAAIIMCEAVNSPAVLINQGIDSVFKGLEGTTAAQYNNNNLPVFLTQIAGIASKVAGSLVLGGFNGNTAVKINETQLGVAAANAAGNAVFPPATLNQGSIASGVVISPPAPSTSGAPGAYTLTWQVSPQLNTASYVTINGPGISSSGKIPTSGNYDVIPPAGGGTYVITAFDATGKVLGSASTTIVPTTNSGTNGGLTFNSSSPTVAGAFTNKPALNLRGPAISITPRGE